INIVGNSFVRKPDVNDATYEIGKTAWSNDPPTNLQVYVSGNLGPHRTDDSQPQDALVDPASRTYLVNSPHAGPQMNISSAATAYDIVLAQAGANAPKRDAADVR